MNELIAVERIAGWEKLKTLVLGSVSSPITKRVYNIALNEFMEWFQDAPRPGFTKATVSAWRVSLEERRLGSSSVIIRKSAIRKLVAEGADNGLLVSADISQPCGNQENAARRSASTPRSGSQKSLPTAGVAARWLREAMAIGRVCRAVHPRVFDSRFSGESNRGDELAGATGFEPELANGRERQPEIPV